jgi:hypothetical protein
MDGQLRPEDSRSRACLGSGLQQNIGSDERGRVRASFRGLLSHYNEAHAEISAEQSRDKVHAASAERQKVIDEREPLKASLHCPGSVAAKQIKGKKVCLNGYDTLQSSSSWEKMAIEAFGFPGAELK